MKVELLYFQDCPNWKVADRRLRSLADELGLTLDCRVVSTPEEAEAVGFHGSPTILVEGRDPFARVDEPPVGLTCRIYQTPDGPAGAPTLEQLRAVFGAAS
jgi:hypothetical protein